MNANSDDFEDFIFGYGSILNRASRCSTFASLGSASQVAYSANLSKSFGYQRRWCFRSSTGFTALGIVRVAELASTSSESSATDINGVLFPIESEDSLRNFDKRETGYYRVLVPSEYISLLPESQQIPEGLCANEIMNPTTTSASEVTHTDKRRIWIYIPELGNMADPDDEYPILQTYVDVCIRGCLEFGGEQLAHHFVRSTFGWNEFWLNDAPLSRRPWLHRPEYMVIDKCLQDHGDHVNFSYRKHPEEFASSHLTALRGMWNVPPRSSVFVGREGLLASLHDKLYADGSHAGSN